MCLGISPLSAQDEAVLLGTWTDPSLPGSTAYNNVFNNVIGYAQAGREYAVIGSTYGMHIVDVTDASNPAELFRIKGRDSGGLIINRDFRIFQHYLYAVCDQGAASLQIIDLSGLPDSVSVKYDQDTLFTRAHTVFIDTAKQKIYFFAVKETEQGYVAMAVMDLSENPLDPKPLGYYSQWGNFKVSHVHEGVVFQDIAYLNCGYDGFAVVDFQDPSNPVLLSALTDYPYKGYNHSGYPDQSLSWYYMADENHGYDLKILNVQDPSNIEVSGTFNGGFSNPGQIAHNELVDHHCLYVSYYYDGLAVFDISTPDKPLKVKHFDTCNLPDGSSYEGAWGVYPFLPSGNILISDMQNGLFVIQDLNELCRNVLGTSDLPASSFSVYPNPAVTHCQLQFPHPVRARFQATLHSLLGRQLPFTETLMVENGKATLWFPGDLVAGLYSLVLRDPTTGDTFSQKLLIRP